MSPHFPSPELARVESRQMPIFTRDPLTVCEELELPRREMHRAFRDGYLSFDPEHVGKLDEASEAELRFVGSLIAAGCPRSMLKVLLRDLEKPYRYDIRRMYYDWRGGKWCMLPGEADAEGTFFALLDRLEAREARDQLVAIRAWLDEALDLEETSKMLFEHASQRMQPPGQSPTHSRPEDSSAAC